MKYASSFTGEFRKAVSNNVIPQHEINDEFVVAKKIFFFSVPHIHF